MSLDKLILVAAASLLLSACGGGSGGGSESKDEPSQPNLIYYNTYSQEVGQCSHVASENSEQAAQWVGAGGALGKCPTTDVIAYCANLPVDPRFDFQIYYYSSTPFDHTTMARGCEHLGGIYTQGSPVPTNPDSGPVEIPDSSVEELIVQPGVTGFMNYMNNNSIYHGKVWNITERHFNLIPDGEHAYYELPTNAITNALGQKITVVKKPVNDGETLLMAFNHSTGSLSQISDTRWADKDVCIESNYHEIFISENHATNGCWQSGNYGFYINPLADSTWQPVGVSFIDLVTSGDLNRLVDVNGLLKGFIKSSYDYQQKIYLYDEHSFSERELNFTGEADEYGKPEGLLYLEDSNILIKYSGRLYRFTRDRILNGEQGIDITTNFSTENRRIREINTYKSKAGIFIRSESYTDSGTTYHEYYDLDENLKVSINLPQNGTSKLFRTGDYNVVATIPNSQSSTTGVFQYYNLDWSALPAAGLSFNLSSESCIRQGTDSYAVINGSEITVVKGFSEYTKTNAQLIYLVDASSLYYGPGMNSKFMTVDLTSGDLSVFEETGNWLSDKGRVQLTNPITQLSVCSVGSGFYRDEKYVVNHLDEVSGFLHGDLTTGDVAIELN